MAALLASTVPGWQDVIPVPQDDGPSPVVAINYSEEFKELMDLFRAVLANNEVSERVLSLTQDILEKNAGNYTVWQYRRECLVALGRDLNAELDYMDTYAVDNPKNYQIWYHRRVIVSKLGDPSRELRFCDEVLEEDSKNYHAWAHRQWVLNTYAVGAEAGSVYSSWWQQELDLVENLIALDVRNNSAWNQRWMVTHKRSDIDRQDDAKWVAALLAECAYVTKSISRVKLNESSWNYLRGLWDAHKEIDCVKTTIMQFCNTTVADAAFENNMFLYALLADMEESCGNLHKAEGYLRHLTSIDGLRVKYWNKRVQEVRARST